MTRSATIARTNRRNTFRNVLRFETLEPRRVFACLPSPTSGPDHIVCDGSNDTISGGLGRDRVYGGPGNDTVGGGQDDDYVIMGEEGDDWVYGGRGNDGDMAFPITVVAINGGPGSDRVFGGDGNDVVQGGQNDDWVYGDDDPAAVQTNPVATGNDWVAGGLGNDNLFGQGGADTFYFQPESAGITDTINDWTPAQGDRIDLTAFDAESIITDFGALTMLQFGANTQITLPTGQKIVLVNTLVSNVSRSHFIGNASIAPIAPWGHIDAINSDGTMDGWAFDPNSPNQVISVHIYVDGEFVGATATIVQRADVNSAFNLSGTHGFRFVLPERFADGRPLLDFTARNWTVFGIDSSGNGDNQLIGSSLPLTRPDGRSVSYLPPFRVAVPLAAPPVQALDTVTGTISDADAPGGIIRYQILVDGGSTYASDPFSNFTDSAGKFTFVLPPIRTLGTQSQVQIVAFNQGSTGRTTTSLALTYNWEFFNTPATSESSPIFQSGFPSNLSNDQVITGSRVFYYHEWISKSIQTPLKLSATGPGNFIGTNTQFTEMQLLSPGSAYPATDPPLPQGTRIDSYYVHFDPVNEPIQPWFTYTTGTITFPNRILGVVTDTGHFLDSNKIESLGQIGRVYGDTSLEIREIGAMDSIRILSDGRSIRYALRARPSTDAFRVITEPTNVVPSFTGASSFTMNENSLMAGQALAFDPDNGPTPLTYSVDTSSLDGRLFSINSSGTLSFLSPPDFENPLDQDHNNEYEMNISISDGSATITNGFRVRVSNVIELLRPAQIGDGSTQRSIIRQVVLDFDDAITFESGAFVVQQRRNDAGVISFVDVITQPNLTTLPNGGSRVTLTFSGSLTFGFGALVDGNYQLTVDGAKVKSLSNNSIFDGNADGSAGGNLVHGAQLADQFFSLFGDTNGDGVVGMAEFGQFRSAFGKTNSQAGYNSLFDYDGDGAVGVSDFGQFRARFGRSRMPF